MRTSTRWALVAVLMMTGCATMRPANDGPIKHIVVVWLKEPGNETNRQKLIDRARTFTKIPGLTSVSSGTVLPSERMGVDSTFDVAFIMTFAGEQALRDYEQNPIHKKAVQEVLAPLAAKFVMYDFRVR
ncbi:hypothetical protein BH09PLA1_BH09PLA1_17420 [soil metagenome]